jgi:GT2 family glycosyltransferase
MISIITAIHNQIEMNKVFIEYLNKYTYYPFELIVIDNASSDESASYFEANGAIVIRNTQNYSYPYSQNQGIAIAKYDILAFLNNDIIVAPNWDKHLIESMQANDLDVITVCGIERVETMENTRKLSRKWKRIKNIIGIAGLNKFTLKLMHKLMYHDWEKYCLFRYEKFRHSVIEGFVGNSVVMTRRAIEKIGLWDARIQGADFDLYVRSKKRNIEFGDIKPCHIALDVYHHHYIRITSKSNPPNFADANNLISLEHKWGKQNLDIYLKDNVET